MPPTPMLRPRRLVVEDLRIKLLLYGDPGAGKTTFTAQSGDHESLAPILFLNFEGGLLSVVERGDIDAVDINTIADLEQVYEALRSGHKDYAHYNTVIIDSASELYSQALVEATQTGIERDARRGKNTDRSADDTEIGDYGRAGKAVYRIFRGFRDLPLNIIATSTARYTYPRNADKQSTEPTEVGPSFSGQLATQMLGLFDFVWYLYTGVNEDEEAGEIGDTFRYILTQNAGAFKAKTRGFTFAESLGEVVVNPYLPDMYNLLLQTGGSTARPQVKPMGSMHLPIPEPEEPELTAEAFTGAEPAYLPGSAETAEAVAPPTERQRDVFNGRPVEFDEETSEWIFSDDGTVVPTDPDVIAAVDEPEPEPEPIPEPPKMLKVTRAKGAVEVPV